MLGCGAGPGSEPGRPGGSGQASAGTPSATVEARSSVLEGETGSGRYRVRARPASPPLVLHRMHAWIVGIEPLGGAPEPTAVHFDGGMPSHGHGLVTRPRVTRDLGGGEVLVEGVKFHMPGAWVLRIAVTSGTTSDSVTLPLSIEP